MPYRRECVKLMQCGMSIEGVRDRNATEKEPEPESGASEVIWYTSVPIILLRHTFEPAPVRW